MAHKLIFCLILAIYPFTSFADNSACKPVNKKKIICKYRGGKWKNDKCVYKKRRRRVKKRRYFKVVRKYRCKKIVRRYVNIINSCKPKVIVMSCNKEKEPKKVVPITLIQPASPKVKIVKDQDFFDWDMGVGTFALGVFNTQEKQFLTGFYGTVVFRLWDRINFAGFLGGSVWQDANLYISSKLGVRVYKRLTLNSGLHAFFGDFAGSRIRRRFYFGSIGLEYLFKKRFNVSLETLFGLKSFVPPSCDDQENNFMVGIMLKFSFYFSI